MLTESSAVSQPSTVRTVKSAVAADGAAGRRGEDRRPWRRHCRRRRCHALAERGHEVHVYDRRSDIASDTSASTAGLVAPGHSYAWASPKAPAMLVKSLLGESTSIRVRLRADADLMRWGLRFIRECTPSRSRTNTLAKLRLARYSQQLMDVLAAREGLQYWQTHTGVLYLFHEEADLRAAETNSRLLQEHGRRQ